MSKTIKKLMSDSLRRRYDGVDEACVVNVMGLNVADTIDFRRELAAKNMKVGVVKNSLARLAFEGGPLEVLGRGLDGPCALVVGGNSVIDVAREMVELAKKFPQVELKTGLMAGDVELTPLSELAKLKSHAELMGEVAMLAASPGRAIAGCLSSPQSKIAGCLKAIADKEAA